MARGASTHAVYTQDSKRQNAGGPASTFSAKMGAEDQSSRVPDGKGYQSKRRSKHEEQRLGRKSVNEDQLSRNRSGVGVSKAASLPFGGPMPAVKGHEKFFSYHAKRNQTEEMKRGAGGLRILPRNWARAGGRGRKCTIEKTTDTNRKSR